MLQVSSQSNSQTFLMGGTRTLSLTATPTTVFLAYSIQLHWLSGVTWTSGMLLPQGLCTGCLCCLQDAALPHATHSLDFTAFRSCSSVHHQHLYHEDAITSPYLTTLEQFLKPQKATEFELREVQIWSLREVIVPTASWINGIWWINAQPPILWLGFYVGPQRFPEGWSPSYAQQ